MIYKDFDQLTEKVLSSGTPRRCGVVMAHDEHTLDAVKQAEAEGFITPVYIDGDTPEEAMEKAVALVHAGEVDMLMKGLMPTAKFMGALVKRANGLRTGSLISMLTMRKLPNYHKLIAMTDTGICEQPTLEQKKALIENAVVALRSMGFDEPKVAVLSAAEEVNPRMSSSTDGAALKELWENGEIKDCIVEGPISIDLAISKEAAQIKGYDSLVAGDADLLLFPDLAAANICGKLLAQVTGLPAGILILGTKVPAIVCSRSATVETKRLCIALAAACK